MNNDELRSLASQLLQGELAVDEFLRRVQTPVAELESATLDLDRARRCGFPEVVFGEGKSPEILVRILDKLRESNADILATRVSAEKAEHLLRVFPAGRYNPTARIFRIPQAGRDAAPSVTGRVAVVTAGTSDLPVAEEARETLDWMHVAQDMIHDVGVAGPQRLLRNVERLREADAVVVVAGMEGALPSVVGGHVACPVIGVPTSVGYGAAFAGVAALLGMLTSCAANVAVVNIDAGFKAGYLAGMIARRSHARSR